MLLEYNVMSFKTVLYNISQYYCFYCIFDQINTALMNIWDFIQKH